MFNGHQSTITPRLLASLLAAATLPLLTGCSTNFSAVAPAAASHGLSLSGSVHGGQQPLVGTRIYLFAAGATGYASPSVSLLNTTLPAVSTDTSGNGYVLTDSIGSFNISGDWTCPHATDQLYLLATGGNPGMTAGTNNSAIAMMDLLGTCSSINASTTVILNELTTVAATTALQQFMTDGTHLGSSSTNTAGLANAIASSLNIVPFYGPNSAALLTPAGNGSIPQAKLNTLANILAACVNTSAPTSTQCASLFSNATPSGGSTPTDTLVAALDIAKNPAGNVSALYGLSTSNPPFQPTLSSAPADWTIAVTYTLGASPALPGFLAIDAIGNVFISNQASQKSPFTNPDTIIKLGPDGSLLSGSGYTAGSVNLPEGIAVDDTGNVYIANTPSSIIKLDNNGKLASGFPYVGGNFPQGIALDKTANVWFSNNQGNNATEISAGGSFLQSVSAGSSLSAPQGVSIDPSSNVWIAAEGSNDLVELSSSGAVLSGATGFTGGGLNAPSGTGIDGAGKVFIVNSTFGSSASTLSAFNNNGSVATGSPYSLGTAVTYNNILAVDGAGSVWTAGCGPQCLGRGTDNISHVSNNGTLLSPPSGFLDSNLKAPQAVAVDASGNLWVGNSAGQANAVPGTVTQFLGVAAPVKTPIQAALKAGLLGQRP